MSEPLAVPLSSCYLLLNHGPVTLVTSAAGEKSNVMAASWVMPLDFDPPKVLVVIDRNTMTRKLVEASGEFGLSIPGRDLAGPALAAGSLSGFDGDKFARSGLAARPAERIAVPLVAGCLAWLECRVIAEPRNEDRYDLFIAEVLSASADPRAFADGRWRFAAGSPRTIHYQAGGSFFETGESFSVAGPMI